MSSRSQTMAMQSAHYVRGVATVTVISAVFGLWWGLTGTAGFPPPFDLLGQSFVLVITLALFTVAFGFSRLARRSPSTDDEHPVNPFRTRAYLISVLFMALAIPVASFVLRTNGFAAAVVSVIAIIVGLHFFGLIRAFDSQRFAFLGGGMCLVGLLSLGLPTQMTLNTGASIALRQTVVGIGCTLTLWVSVLGLTISTWQAVR